MSKLMLACHRGQAKCTTYHFISTHFLNPALLVEKGGIVVGLLGKFLSKYTYKHTTSLGWALVGAQLALQ